MPSESDIEVLNPGATVRGRYEVVRRLKVGGMGAVYEVLDRETHRRRAMKTLLPSFVADADLRARFQLEVRVAANVESEHIVEVFDAGVDDLTGLPFLVMELLKGESLASALEHRGRLPPDEVVALLFQASLALDRTHAAGIVHRDLKPENLFLTRRDDGAVRLKVLDFGIAKIASQTTAPNTTRNLGTPLYMSPEQVRGDGAIGPAADLYALAHIAFCLLTGEAYWMPEAEASGVYALLVKVVEGMKEAPTVRAARGGVQLPAAFDAWFSRATAREASGRFGSASELVEELARTLGTPLPGVSRAPFPSVSAVSSPGAPALGRSRALVARGADSMGALSSAPPGASSFRRASKPLYAVALLGAGAGAAVVALQVMRAPDSSESPAAPGRSAVSADTGLSPRAAGEVTTPLAAPATSGPSVTPLSSPPAEPPVVAPSASTSARSRSVAAPVRAQKPPPRARSSENTAKPSYDPTDVR